MGKQRGAEIQPMPHSTDAALSLHPFPISLAPHLLPILHSYPLSLMSLSVSPSLTLLLFPFLHRSSEAEGVGGLASLSRELVRAKLSEADAVKKMRASAR
jgi:hypothetical protein